MHFLLLSVGLGISAFSMLIALRLGASPQRLVRLAISMVAVPSVCCAVGGGAAELVPGYVCNADAEICRGMAGKINVAPTLAVLFVGGLVGTGLAAFAALPLLAVAARRQWRKPAGETTC